MIPFPLLPYPTHLGLSLIFGGLLFFVGFLAAFITACERDYEWKITMNKCGTAMMAGLVLFVFGFWIVIPIALLIVGMVVFTVVKGFIEANQIENKEEFKKPEVSEPSCNKV